MMISAFVPSLRRSFAVAFIALLVFAPCAYAANDLWVGNTSANWADLNWSGGNNPPLTGDALLFGVAGSSGTTLNNNLATDFVVGSVTFNSGAAGFTFNGNEIILNGNITNSSTVAQTINLPIVANGTRTVTLTSGGGNVTLAGVTNGFGGFTTAGTGTLTMNSANLYTGGTTTATGAILNLANANAVQYSTLNVNANNTLTFASGITNFNIGGLASSAGVGNFAFTDAGSNAVTLSVGLNNASTTYNGVMTSGAGAGLVKVGTGTLTLAGANAPFTGTTTINNGGITVTGASLGSTSLQLAGGTLTVNNSAANLNFANTTLNGGASTVTDTAGSVGLGAITRNVGATLNVSGSGASSTSGTANTIITDSGAAYATVGQDWAAKNAANTNIVGLSTITGGYTNSTATSLSGNADVAAGINTTIAGDTSITSLRFNQAQVRTINLGSSALTTGGILMTTAVGGNAQTITGGTLKGASGKDLVVIQNNTGNVGTLTIGSVIADNGGATGLTKAGGGTLVLTGSNSYTGATRVNAGAAVFHAEQSRQWRTDHSVWRYAAVCSWQHAGSVDFRALSHFYAQQWPARRFNRHQRQQRHLCQSDWRRQHGKPDQKRFGHADSECGECRRHGHQSIHRAASAGHGQRFAAGAWPFETWQRQYDSKRHFDDYHRRYAGILVRHWHV